MPSKFFHAIFTSLVLRICLSYSTVVQLPENTTPTLRQPMEFIKSSLDTSSSDTKVSKHERGENVRAIEDIRLPASIGVNFYRLPPSPANLLKPDGFQFYAYNEKGDMITRQMTMQEIQALIAGGGPDHSNIVIQEPQKVEDTLTGGKKVIDVVEKVQSVLKSAMDKPLSTLTGPHPTIPEKANVEWSNILPAILAGDKYGSKIEEHQYVEESTLKSITTFPVQNISFSAESEGNISETVSPVAFGQITGADQVQNNEMIMQSEKNGSLAVPPVLTSDTITSPFTEKIMIPVRVITTEQVVQHTTQSYNVNRITEAIPSMDSIQYEHHNRPTEKDSATMDIYDTESTTAGSHFSSPFEATKNIFDNAVFLNVSSGVDTKGTQTNDTKPIVGDISVGEADVPLKIQTSSALELNQIQASVSKEPFSTGPSFQYTTSVPNYSTALMKGSSTIGYDTVTKVSDFLVTTQHLKPLSIDLVNSLSSVISQVSDDVSSVLTGPSEFESAPSGNDNVAHDNSSESTVSESRATTWSPVVIYEDEGTTIGKDMLGENVRDSFAETTLKFAVDREIFSSTSPESITLSSTPIAEKGIINYLESLTDSVTSQTVSAVQLSLNMAEGTSSNGPLGIIMTTPSPLDSSEINTLTVNNSNSSKPVAIIDSILRTVSASAATPALESVIIPNTLPNGFLANTFASALIAGFDSQNLVKTQIESNNVTTLSLENLPLTSTTLNSKLSTLAINNTTTKEEPPVHFSQLSNSHGDVTTLETADETMFAMRTSTDSLQPQNDFSITLESTTISSSSSSSVSSQYTLNPVHVSLVTSNVVSTNQNTGLIGSSLPLDSQKTDGGSEVVVQPTVNVSLETGQSPASSPQEALQKSDKISVAHFNENTTEISATERSELSANKSEYINANVNSTESGGQHQQHHTIVGSLNSTVTSTQELTNTPETQQKNETIQSLDTAVTYSVSTVPSAVIHEWTTTTNIPKISSENYVGDFSNETASAQESNADRNVTGTKHAINSIDLDRLENKIEMLVELYENNASTHNPIGSQLLGGSKLESQVKEESEKRENFTMQKKTNGTNVTNSHHAWQRISLHQTTPTLATKFTTPMKEVDISVSTMATTMFETNTIKMEAMHLQPTSLMDRESAVSLDASKGSGGLDISTGKASNDIVNFSRFCNELAIKFWIAANKGLSTGRSLALSPFGMISLLAMIFLGVRGSTSDQMNEVLGLDNVATFNPHLIFQNVTDTVSLARHQGIANAAFVRELFADKVKVRKLLPFYKEQAQQFYEGLVAEVNFATISDLVRRRTNLLVRKQTGGRIKDFVKSNAVPLRSPLAAISANVFQTDCNTSSASVTGRDGELYFAVSSAHRLRKLIPVPATVWRSNVLAGYEPSLDATAVAIGGIDKLVSTIFLLPGQQGHVAPGDTLDRLEQRFVKGAFREGGWQKLLKVLIPRPGLELQLPKFSHRSVVNATAALKRMGLDQLFSNHADFKGINGIGNRLFLSDVLQMNLFSTCGDENIANGRHHVEVYPASPSLRNSRRSQLSHNEEAITVDKNLRQTDARWRSHRGVSMKDGTVIADRAGEKPRLKLDQPFLYFVRHNPTGLILHMGRFNPRLL